MKIPVGGRTGKNSMRGILPGRDLPVLVLVFQRLGIIKTSTMRFSSILGFCSLAHSSALAEHVYTRRSFVAKASLLSGAILVGESVNACKSVSIENVQEC